MEERLTVEQLTQMLREAAKRIIEKEPYLTKIDTVIGDGDHGIGMKRGFTALRNMLEQQEFSTVDQLLRASGMELVKTMGGASGVIFGTMFTGGLMMLPKSSSMTLPELAGYLAQGEQAIERRGGARAGQKTMLDALIPAVEALKKAAVSGMTLEQALHQAYLGAVEGMETSKNMRSRTGRSKNFQEATIGLPDPGAISTSFIFQGFYEGYLKTKKEDAQ